MQCKQYPECGQIRRMRQEVPTSYGDTWMKRTFQWYHRHGRCKSSRHQRREYLDNVAIHPKTESGWKQLASARPPVVTREVQKKMVLIQADSMAKRISQNIALATRRIMATYTICEGARHRVRHTGASR
eukprot:symbB.v1.2.003178.t1/scaffold173.1/size339812/21